MHEPIILPSVDRARIWVDLCAKSISVPAEKAALILATLCGFGSWDVMTYAIETMPPSPADEELEPDQYRYRLKSQLRILVHDHDLDVGEAMMLLGLLPPTSREPHKAFKMTDTAGFSELQIQAFQEYAGEFLTEMVDEMPPGVLQSVLENHALRLAEPNRATVALALSGHTNPESWLHILDFLCWSYDCFDDQCPDLDEPSYTIYDQSLGAIPVYLSPIARAPVSNKRSPADRAQRVQRALCVGDYVTNWKERSAVALLLQRWPLINEVDGQIYCHLGSVYDGEKNQWTDLLFNRQCTSVAKLLKLNDRLKDIRKGCPELVDTDADLSNLATICLSGLHLEEMADYPEPGLMVERIQLPGSRWMVQKVASDQDGDDS